MGDRRKFGQPKYLVTSPRPPFESAPAPDRVSCCEVIAARVDTEGGRELTATGAQQAAGAVRSRCGREAVADGDPESREVARLVNDMAYVGRAHGVRHRRGLRRRLPGREQPRNQRSGFARVKGSSGSPSERAARVPAAATTTCTMPSSVASSANKAPSTVRSGSLSWSVPSGNHEAATKRSSPQMTLRPARTDERARQIRHWLPGHAERTARATACGGYARGHPEPETDAVGRRRHLERNVVRGGKRVAAGRKDGMEVAPERGSTLRGRRWATPRPRRPDSPTMSSAALRLARPSPNRPRLSAPPRLGRQQAQRHRRCEPGGGRSRSTRHRDGRGSGPAGHSGHPAVAPRGGGWQMELPVSLDGMSSEVPGFSEKTSQIEHPPLMQTPTKRPKTRQRGPLRWGNDASLFVRKCQGLRLYWRRAGRSKRHSPGGGPARALPSPSYQHRASLRPTQQRRVRTPPGHLRGEG